MGDDQDATWLIVMVVGALLCGLIVLYLKPDYRFNEIIRSNEHYYPAIEPTAPGETDSGGQAASNSGGR